MVLHQRHTRGFVHPQVHHPASQAAIPQPSSAVVPAVHWAAPHCWFCIKGRTSPKAAGFKAGIIIVYSSRDSGAVETEPNGDSSVTQLLTQPWKKLWYLKYSGMPPVGKSWLGDSKIKIVWMIDKRALVCFHILPKKTAFRQDSSVEIRISELGIH